MLPKSQQKGVLHWNLHVVFALKIILSAERGGTESAADLLQKVWIHRGSQLVQLPDIKYHREIAIIGQDAKG